jgi:predicted DNA-binding transcriptional regulator YafY
VIGRDCQKDGLRTFSLDRILNVKDLELFFQSKGDFDTKEFFEHSMGITVTDSKPEEVILKVHEKMAPYLMSQPLHQSQQVINKKNGVVELSIKVLITVELVSTILGFGDQVEVVYPDTLRQELNLALTKALSYYR